MSAVSSISVIMPVFNGERFIEAALTSIGNQSVPVSEVLVIDDGSTDRSADLARAHPIGATVLCHENKGPSVSRNRGIQMAKGSHLAFLDADDMWRPDKLALQCAAFDADPDLMVCFGRVDYFWEDPDCAEAKAFVGHARTNAVEGYVSTTMLARASVFDRVGLFDESLFYNDSVAWCTKMRDLGVRSRMLDEVLLDHRRHDTNITLRKKESTSEILAMLANRRKAAKEAQRDEL